MFGTRWWIEGDIKGFFDHMDHQVLMKILNKRIKDQRFLHLVQQFLKAGYVEDWRYHQTYSGVPQGGCISPLLSNIYLHELDQAIEQKIQTFNKGKARKKTQEYTRISQQAAYAKKRARQTGAWKRYKALRTQMLRTPSVDHFDAHYRRLTYVRYADDFLLGVIGARTDAEELKTWVEMYLQEHLHLELSREKTLITHAKERVRFLGYDIQRWNKHRIYRFRTQHGSVTRRTGSYQLRLFMPRDKTVAFANTFGDTRNWRGKHRPHLLHLSEPEILLIYNAEVRGFLGYYALADNLKFDASKVLKITTESFFRTLANKRQSTLKKVARSLKRGPGQYVVSLSQEGKPTREYELIATTRHLHQETVNSARIDQKPPPMMYQTTTELGKRLLAQVCEWCGTQQGHMEVHHIRKLKDLKGKAAWERKMIARRRKTMVLCGACHDRLHAGTLKESERKT
jgi:hypothetical protein